MYFGLNLQYLRKLNGNMSQEKLAERLGVSRQAISKWETEETFPEIPKLLEICDLFSCKLDPLLREDMMAREGIYSPVEIVRVPAFRMARYVIISPQPEDDVNGYMDRWAQRSGLLEYPGYQPRRIGWDFPFLSPEQKNRFGLRGYAAAWVLPEGFEPTCPGVEIAGQDAADYAVITIRDPFQAAFDRIPHGYQRILEYLKSNNFKENRKAECLPCFEWVYEKDGVPYMNVYIHTDGGKKTNPAAGLW